MNEKWAEYGDLREETGEEVGKSLFSGVGHSVRTFKTQPQLILNLLPQSFFTSHWGLKNNSLI